MSFSRKGLRDLYTLRNWYTKTNLIKVADGFYPAKLVLELTVAKAPSMGQYYPSNELNDKISIWYVENVSC